MTPSVKIIGDGVSAYCSAHLLAKAGFAVTLEPVERPRVPALLISASALALMRDIFEQPKLFQTAHSVTQRRVSWERNRPEAEVEHRAIVISEGALLAELGAQVAMTPQSETACNGSEWTIRSVPPLTTAGGNGGAIRKAVSWRVELHPAAPLDVCVMESLPSGWLFLLPTEPGYGWMLAVGDLGPDPLAASRVVRREVRWLLGHSPEFSVAPRISSQLAGPYWLASGSAAMTFDPICGDGVGQAIREAILAAAVVRAAAKGEPAETLIAHYASRMRAGFSRHLGLVSAFYSNGYGGRWWDAQAPAVAKPDGFEFRYQLAGLELQAVGR